MELNPYTFLSIRFAHGVFLRFRAVLSALSMPSQSGFPFPTPVAYLIYHGRARQVGGEDEGLNYLMQVNNSERGSPDPSQSISHTTIYADGSPTRGLPHDLPASIFTDMRILTRYSACHREATETGGRSYG